MLHVLVLAEENSPSCDQVMEKLENLRAEFPRLRVRRRKLEEEPEVASTLGVVATPAIIVNDQLAFQGMPHDAALESYFRNVVEGLHDDPESYPPEDERHPDNRGQEATGSMDPDWRGSGRVPASHGTRGGRHG